MHGTPAKSEGDGAQHGGPTPAEDDKHGKEKLQALKNTAIKMTVDTFHALLSEREGSGKIWASRSEEHKSELQSLMRIPYALFCLKKKNAKYQITYTLTV